MEEILRGTSLALAAIMIANALGGDVGHFDGQNVTCMSVAALCQCQSRMCENSSQLLNVGGIVSSLRQLETVQKMSVRLSSGAPLSFKNFNDRNLCLEIEFFLIPGVSCKFFLVPGIAQKTLWVPGNNLDNGYF